MLSRRNFFKTLGLSGLGIALPWSNLLARPRTTKTSALRVEGMVRAANKGIPGVVVSDGNSVVMTDSKGRYAFTTGADSEFVHVSIPAGYAFPTSEGVASFYRRIENSGKLYRADFDLEKLATDDTRHTFVVWADTQIQNPEDARLLHTESVPDVVSLVKQYGDNPLIHGLGCGDLVWDKFELFPEYKRAIASTGIPFFQVIGNHDMDIDARTDDASAETFKKHFGPTYYSFNRGRIHYVVLDDVFFIGTSKRYIGYLAEQQLRWLEKDLSHIPAGSTVVVAVHIPVNTGAARRNNMKEDPIGGVVANRKALYELLRPYKVHIMSGHTHFNEKVFEGENIIEHVHGTVCGAWWTGPICYDGTPNGYGVYEVNGSEVAWYYKSVGHDKNHQMRVYPVGYLKERPDSFSVNVWNWDPAWKVQWFENGEPKGEMERSISFDPLSIELHEGAEKPSRRAWVDPVLTDHMFFANPSAAAATVEVRVTDRFGNIFNKSVSRAELYAQNLPR